MKITAISDLHGYYPKLPGGDLLIFAGDYTASDKLYQYAEFFRWLKKLDYKKKILIAGNHDNLFESGFPKNQKEADELKGVQDFIDITEDFEYLCDSGTEFEGLKIYGLPWTHRFKGINPICTAFTYEDESWFCDEKVANIPLDTDILITHGPAYGSLDKTVRNEHVGSKSLCGYLKYRIRTKAHIFGHIHESYGQKEVEVFASGKESIMKSINCSHVNERYQPVNEPITFEL